MHENLRGRLIESLGHDVPDYVVDYVDRANDLYHKVGYGDAPWQVMPLLLLMAELDHRSGEKTSLPFVADEDDPTIPPAGARRGGLDMRTREGRAMKLVGAT